MTIGPQPTVDRSDRPRSAYLHVPFCPHVCPYCDFHKMRRNEELVARYLDRLEEEIVEAGRRHPGSLDTLYLGGGTPSHLSDAELERVFTALDRAFGLPATVETTIEADPRTFGPERLRTFRAFGIDRLSVGLQSTQDAVLSFLGRAHDAREALDAVRFGLDAGFRVSADLITAVPGQDAEADLRTAAATGVDHLSVYGLTIEPFTPFALRRVRVDEDRAADDFDRATRVLAELGFARYEVSNHAVPGSESRHNQAYWHGAYFLAFGPSAAAFLPADDGIGERVTNLPIKAWLRGDPPLRERPGAEGHVLERLMTGLRTVRGVDLDAVRARTGIDVLERYRAVVAEEVTAGRLTVSATPSSANADVDATGEETTDRRAGAGATLRATDDGLRVLDAVLRRFFAA